MEQQYGCAPAALVAAGAAWPLQPSALTSRTLAAALSLSRWKKPCRQRMEERGARAGGGRCPSAGSGGASTASGAVGAAGACRRPPPGCLAPRSLGGPAQGGAAARNAGCARLTTTTLARLATCCSASATGCTCCTAVGSSAAIGARARELNGTSVVRRGGARTTPCRSLGRSQTLLSAGPVCWACMCTTQSRALCTRGGECPVERGGMAWGPLP